MQSDTQSVSMCSTFTLIQCVQVCRLKNVLVFHTNNFTHLSRASVETLFTQCKVIQVALTLTRDNERLRWKMNAKYLVRGGEGDDDAWIWDDSTHYTHFTPVTMTFWQAFCLKQKSLRTVPEKKKKSEKVFLCVHLLLHLHFKGDTRRRCSWSYTSLSFF